MTVADAKGALRTRLLAARAARPAEERASAGAALASHLLGWDVVQRARTVAAYLSFGDEPPTGGLVDALLATGTRVLAPRIEPGGVLTWVPADGQVATRAGRLGVPEPIGAAEPRGLGAADLVLVPGLAVDRRGVRLGRGAGYYDRALDAAGPQVPRVAVLFADELLAVGEVSAEPHDRRVTHAVTPDGIVRLS